MSTALLILGCSATKRHDAGLLPALGPALLPAVDRYDGPLYRVLRSWQRRTPDHAERLEVAVLSARFGLFGAHVPITDYDQRMTRVRALELRPDMDGVLRAAWPGPWSEVYISLGATYRLALPDPLPWPVAWAAGGIGERLAQLKGWLGGLS